MKTLTCFHCGFTGKGVHEYENLGDWDVLRDTFPPTIALCEDTRACVARMTAPTAVVGAMR